ncbi:MAG: type II secretion system GspH family protein [Tepidibacter sp.]|jgi:prepilin-type N-terminal cleavage/methylation domain-containing protein|uniref:type IV pilus modification PilV family protein n=1 Tax=Tepidibacter sp. TaxID=2529387 RepID=UPI0025ED8FA4|nr:type II secretion system protein [Tepidibacter sp.]MCT4509435.1 type II secretion system GspH family protein [Tepidibacter sp.]
MIKCNKGLTLVELIVSLAILGIIMTPLASFFINTIRINKNSENRLEANQIAQRYMEEAKFGKTLYSQGKIKEGTINKTDKEFKIKIEIEKHSKYEIDKDMKSEENQDTLITDHAQIEIDKQENIQSDTIIFKATDVGNKSENISDDGRVTIDIKKILNNKITIDFNEKYTKTVTNIDLKKDDINIKINCNGNRSPINLEVSTLNDVKTNIYVVKSETSKNKIKLNTLKGKVRLYNNIYDNTVSKKEDSWIYKITVNISKNDKELAKLVGYKNID